MKKQTKLEYVSPALIEFALKLGGDLLVVSIGAYTNDGTEELGEDPNPNPGTNSFMY